MSVDAWMREWEFVEGAGCLARMKQVEIRNYCLSEADGIGWGKG
jgi:hypothetical protein